MGVGEGDFHRTRLTHSLEAGQIGAGILAHLVQQEKGRAELASWLPTEHLVLAACYAHDIGHPPFGHAGERSLHRAMKGSGGFEGNGQTLRILTRLEKHNRPQQGINPTRRFILAILKYPIALSKSKGADDEDHPPKCYMDTEAAIVNWAIGPPFGPEEVETFTTQTERDKPRHRSLDCSLMECADDIAYAVHDLEDIVARRLVTRSEILDGLKPCLSSPADRIGTVADGVTRSTFEHGLFDGGSHGRKQFIGRLVNLFIASTVVSEMPPFVHPLLRYRVTVHEDVAPLLQALKKLTWELVINRAEVQHLERRGERMIAELFRELCSDPESMVPRDTWRTASEADSPKRKVCDYVAGMTDPFAQRIYQRLFVPGFGTSADAL
jgi:dGTPase